MQARAPRGVVRAESFNDECVRLRHHLNVRRKQCDDKSDENDNAHNAPVDVQFKIHVFTSSFNLRYIRCHDKLYALNAHHLHLCAFLNTDIFCAACCPVVAEHFHASMRRKVIDTSVTTRSAPPRGRRSCAFPCFAGTFSRADALPKAERASPQRQSALAAKPGAPHSCAIMPAMPPPTNQMEISCALMPSSIAAITMTATQIMVSKTIPPFSKRKPHTRARPVQAPALPILIISDFHKICKRFSSPEKYFTQIIKYRARFCRARLQYSYRFTCSMLSFTRSPSPVFCTETSI